MLALLTRYLLKYKRLSIPHVGTFQLVQQPSTFDVVDKLISPPSYLLELQRDETVADHQLQYLQHHISADKSSIQQQLEEFGKKMYARLQHTAIEWNGLGRLDAAAGTLELEPIQVQPAGFTAVAAHKMMRENVEHQRLVGDVHTSVQDVPGIKDEKAKNSKVVVAGWILFVITLLLIGFILYKSGFNPLATGLRLNSLALPLSF